MTATSEKVGLSRLGASKLWKLDAGARIGFILLFVGVAWAVFAPYLAPHDPTQQNLSERLTPPVWMGGTPTYILGTDGLGRDQLSRIIYGAGTSLAIGLSATLLAAVVGVPVGLFAGYYRGLPDMVAMRTSDILMTLPGILLALSLLVVLGPSTLNLILVLSVSQWVLWARVVRGEVMSYREREFVLAAKAIGATDLWTLRNQLLPMIVGVLIVQFSVSLTRIILAEASLSFLGFGVQPPTPSWGAMLAAGRNYLASAWWVATFPGVALAMTVMGVNLVGDWLRDRLDPKLRF